MKPFQRALDFLKRKSYDVLFYNNPDDERVSRQWSKIDYMRANEVSLYVNRAISKRAEKVAEVEFFLKDRKTEKVLHEHQLLDLLNKPNDFQTGLQFWGLYQKYRDLTGAAYIWMEPSGEVFNPTKIKALHLLRPDAVSLIYGDSSDGNIITGFRYSYPRGGSATFPAEQIIYAYTPDPIRPTEPISLLRAGTRSIDTELQLATYHSNVIRNGGNVSNVIKFKTPSLTKQQVAELKQQYTDQYAEAKNGGKPLFLGGDADVVKLGMTPVELGHLESKKMVLDDICIMTGVPRAILSVTSGETFANADAAIDVFLRETVKPLLTDLTTTLDWRMIPDQFDLEFKDPTPENVELKLKRLENGFKNSYMTINEARAEEGLEPIEGGDEILVDIRMIPLKDAGKQQTVTPADPNANPNPNDPNAKGIDGPHPLKDAYVREKYGQIMLKRMDRGEKRVLEAMQAYFMGQRTRLIQHVEGVRTFRRKDILDEVFNFEVEINIAKGTILPLIREILIRSGTDAKELAGSTRPFTLTSRIESHLDKRANIFANQITETTFEQLKKDFSESLTAGESRQQLVGRIRSTYDGYSKSRAETIARTEVHNAVQEGTFEGYIQAGLKTKIWVTVGDTRVRDLHRAVDGEEVPIDMLFSNGLRYPGDPEGEPDNTINCRCSI